jgi:hypothetical protein
MQPDEFPEFSWARWLLGLAVMTGGIILPLGYVVMTKNRKAFAKSAKYT